MLLFGHHRLETRAIALRKVDRVSVKPLAGRRAPRDAQQVLLAPSRGCKHRVPATPRG